MKRIGNLYDKVICVESLYQGYYEARKRKRVTSACHRFERRLGAQIQSLHETLADGSYKPKPYHEFMVFEPKPRRICAPAFRDRVVQHAIYNAIRPVFDRAFIEQSFACRVGKGTHSAADYVQSALQKIPRDSYVVQLDIRRYYYSIDRGILRGLIERKIKDSRLVDLIMLFATTSETVGVPIGNLLAQLFGLIYLNPLDHFIKRSLKLAHYARYVDDFVLMGLTLDQARSFKQRIEQFLDEELHLQLSKSSTYRACKGINFVGFRTWASKRFVRKRALYIFRKSVERGQRESIVSSLGHARKTASRRSMLGYIKEHNHELYRQLPESVRSVHHLPAQCA